MNALDIAAKIMKLTIVRTSLPAEPIVTNGWHENADKSITQYWWCRGVLKEGDTLPGWDPLPMYVKLHHQWCDAVVGACGMQALS